MPEKVFSVGKFEVIYDVAKETKTPWCLNDHTFVKGPDGLWHVFAITHPNPMKWEEDMGKNLAHATAKTLTQSPWTPQPFAVTADNAHGEYLLWAPHIVKEGRTYHMFVCGGAKEGHVYSIHHLTSKDLFKWDRATNNPVVTDGFDGRDPMVIRDGKRWILYFTANSKPEGGNHVVKAVESRDLKTWSKEPKTVFTHTTVGTFGGPTESPFVVRRGKTYYLFITDGGTVHVYRSQDPLHWEMKDEVGTIEAHASEVIRDERGNWFVSHVGWMWGPLSLAPLTWHDGLDHESSSLEPAKR